MTPEATSSQKCPAPRVVRVWTPVTPRTTMVMPAKGAKTTVSTLRLVRASTLGPTRFFTKPYSPKLNARIRAIHGS
ncbi:hypothetical protein D3C73_1375040 [compost metagenome]